MIFEGVTEKELGELSKLMETTAEGFVDKLSPEFFDQTRNVQLALMLGHIGACLSVCIALAVPTDSIKEAVHAMLEDMTK